MVIRASYGVLCVVGRLTAIALMGHHALLLCPY